MKSTKYLVGAAALTLALGAGMTSVSAYQGDYSQAGPNLKKYITETIMPKTFKIENVIETLSLFHVFVIKGNIPPKLIIISAEIADKSGSFVLKAVII